MSEDFTPTQEWLPEGVSICKIGSAFEGWACDPELLTAALENYRLRPDHQTWESQDYDRRWQMSLNIHPEWIMEVAGPLSWEELQEHYATLKSQFIFE